MERLRALIRFVKAGPFRGNHQSIYFDDHTIATTGNDAVQRMEEREDRFDQVQSALADRYRDVAYYGEQSW